MRDGDPAERTTAERLKVLFVVIGLDVGGAEHQLTELLLRIDRRTFDPVVCCLGRRGPFADVIEEAGVPIRTLGFRRVRESRWWDVPAMALGLWRFARMVRAERPHIVYGLLYWAYVPAAFVARTARVPAVVSVRMTLGHFKANRPLLLWLERLANRLTDMVVANGEAVRSDAIRQERLPAGKVVVIRNGIDVSRFARVDDDGVRQELGLSPDRIVVGVIANLFEYKGHRVFLDAWTTVVRRHPAATAVFVGDGPLRSQLEERISRDGLTDSVRFLGTRRDIPRVIAALDIVAHPSFEEGSAVAILEALAAAKPVVATSVGGNVEAIVHERTGLLVPAGDATALADAITRLIEDREAARAFGSAGRKLVCDRHDMQEMVVAYERLFLDVWQRAAHGASLPAHVAQTQREP